MTMKRTTIIADADLLDRVDRCARRLGTTKTALVATALEAFLAEHDEPPALGFVGIGRSGHGRLSLDGRALVRRELGAREGSIRRVEPGPRGPGTDGSAGARERR